MPTPQQDMINKWLTDSQTAINQIPSLVSSYQATEKTAMDKWNSQATLANQGQTLLSPSGFSSVNDTPGFTPLATPLNIDLSSYFGDGGQQGGGQSSGGYSQQPPRQRSQGYSQSQGPTMGRSGGNWWTLQRGGQGSAPLSSRQGALSPRTNYQATSSQTPRQRYAS